MTERSEFATWLRGLRGERRAITVTKETGVHWTSIYRTEADDQLLSLRNLRLLLSYYGADWETGHRLMNEARMKRDREKGKDTERMMQQLSYKLSDAAAQIGIGRTKLDQLIARGEIHTFTIGRCRLVTHEELQRFLAAKQQGERTGYGQRLMEANP